MAGQPHLGVAERNGSSHNSDYRESMKTNMKTNMEIYISWRGNKKLSWPVFNIPAKITCPFKTPLCSKFCYATKAERHRPPVLPCRLKNYEATRHPDFVDTVAEAILSKRKPVKIFRIHESGDFYNLAYYDKWVRIAARCKSTKFVAFTKNFAVFEWPHKSRNLKIIASIFPDSPTPPPVGVPTFTAVARGTKGKGTQCKGKCDDCEKCPFATGRTKIWTEIH